MKKLFSIFLMGLVIVMSFVGCTQEQSAKSIDVFCGAASKPVIDEAAKVFEQKTGIKVYANYGGSGAVLSQMKLSKSGDLYIPGSPDYIAIAERDGVIEPQSVKILSYLVPVIAVQSGNPRNIQSLADLAKPGIKVGIGNPQSVCVGLYAVEILEHNKLLAEVSQNIVVHAESCEKTANLVVLKAVDAVIGWHVFHDWNPDSIDVIYMKPNEVPRIAYIPAALSVYAKDKSNAQEFMDFLVSGEGQKIFSKWGYIATESEAKKYAPGAQVGGEYKLPANYKPPVK